MQRGTRAGLSLATASFLLLTLAGTVSTSAKAAPTDGATIVTVSDLVGGDAALRFRRAYEITSCSATSVPLSLFVQTSSGRWVKVATSKTPSRSDACPYSGSPYVQVYDWTVNQVGTPAASGGPNKLNLAVGAETPRSKFVADVWPSAPTYAD